MGIDPAEVKKFWDERARRHADDPGMTNLEEDPELRKLKIELEEARIEEYLGTIAPDAAVLDLGGGYGHWAFRLARRAARVQVVDYCEPLVETGRRKAAEQGIENVAFAHAAAQDFTSEQPFDLVFISGLLLYLNDDELQTLLARLRSYSHPGTVVVLRDGTGIQGRYEINRRWSEALQAYYGAIYRTREDYIAQFAAAGFAHEKDDDMFGPGCVLNKWTETRLRIYRFVRRG